MNVKAQLDNRLGNLKGELENFSQDLRKGGRQVWLASLGAVSLVDEQRRALFGSQLGGGQLGEQFGELVEKGEERRRKIRGEAREAFEKVGNKVEQLGSRAGDRMQSVLGRLGVPTSAQIQLLIERVEQLNHKVEKLAQG